MQSTHFMIGVKCMPFKRFYIYISLLICRILFSGMGSNDGTSTNWTQTHCSCEFNKKLNKFNVIQVSVVKKDTTVRFIFPRKRV